MNKVIALFRDENIHKLLDRQILEQTVKAVLRQIHTKRIIFGGSVPSSCDETDILSQNYDPRSHCTCTGLYTVPPDAGLQDLLQQSQCGAIEKMVYTAAVVNEREEEWNITQYLYCQET